LQYFHYLEQPIFFLVQPPKSAIKVLVVLHGFEFFSLLKLKAKLNCVELMVEEKKSHPKMNGAFSCP